MYELEKCCPECGEIVKVLVDASDGCPETASAECACGMLITWFVETEVVLYLGEVKEVERA